MQSVYSVCGSRLHLILDDEVADGYNRFAVAFQVAQEEHMAKTGTLWDPYQPLWSDVNEKDLAAYNAVGGLMNQLIEINGGSLDIPEEEMTSSLLIKL
jgi:hypothetical protein